MIDISIIIINYNTQEMTLEAIQKVRLHTKRPHEIILIDNGSDVFEEEKFLAEDVTVIRNSENKGFSVAANQGLRKAQGRFLLLLNSDAFVENGVLDTLAQYLERHEKVGVIGARMQYPDGLSQVSAGFFPTFLRAVFTYSTLYKYLPHSMFLYENNYFTRNYFKMPVSVDWISGGCMMIRRSVIEKIGYLDEQFFFGGEDLDYCYQVKKYGWEVVYHPLVEVIHNHGHSSGNVRSLFSLKHQGEGMLKFMKKNFPKRIITRGFIKSILSLKIFLTKRDVLK